MILISESFSPFSVLYVDWELLLSFSGLLLGPPTAHTSPRHVLPTFCGMCVSFQFVRQTQRYVKVKLINITRAWDKEKI